jgi:hypothetical protein
MAELDGKSGGGLRIFRWGEISATEGRITATEACALMRVFEQCATCPPREVEGASNHINRQLYIKSLDLTDQANFDWIGYLKHHPEGEAIVGAGVTKFELRFFDQIDYDTRTWRLDFVVHRDGDETYPHARLHPTFRARSDGPGRAEVWPLFGNLHTRTWTPWKQVQYLRIGMRPPGHHTIGLLQACAFLLKLNTDKGRTDWVVDLTPGDEFYWPNFIAYIFRLQVGASQFLLLNCRTSLFQDEGGKRVELLLFVVCHVHELLGPGITRPLLKPKNLQRSRSC